MLTKQHKTDTFRTWNNQRVVHIKTCKIYILKIIPLYTTYLINNELQQ